MPKDQRLQAIKAAIMLLPDENREVLQILLYFLSDVTAAVKENQMTPTNLAVCLAPSLFHLNTLKRENSSPRYVFGGRAHCCWSHSTAGSDVQQAQSGIDGVITSHTSKSTGYRTGYGILAFVGDLLRSKQAHVKEKKIWVGEEVSKEKA